MRHIFCLIADSTRGLLPLEQSLQQMEIEGRILSGKRNRQKTKTLPDSRSPDRMDRFHFAEAPDTRFLPLSFDNLSLHLCSHLR